MSSADVAQRLADGVALPSPGHRSDVRLRLRLWLQLGRTEPSPTRGHNRHWALCASLSLTSLPQIGVGLPL